MSEGIFRTLSVEEVAENIRRQEVLRAAERVRWEAEAAAWQAARRTERAKEGADRRRAEKAARERAEARELKRAGPARERRSRIEWADLIDDRDVVIRQAGWERNATALAMRAAGMTFRQIGEYMGVTTARARQRVAKAQRVRNRPGHQSPIEHLQRGNVAFQLAQFSRCELRRLAASLQAFCWGTQRDWLLVGSQHVGRAS